MKVEAGTLKRVEWADIGLGTEVRFQFEEWIDVTDDLPPVWRKAIPSSEVGFSVTDTIPEPASYQEYRRVEVWPWPWQDHRFAYCRVL